MNAMILLIAAMLPSERDTQWIVTFEIETPTHVIQRWSAIEDQGQGLRDVLVWPYIKTMEAKGYTLVGIERVKTVRKLPRLPTGREEGAMREAAKAEKAIPRREYNEWLEEHSKSQDGPFIGNGG